MKTITLNYAPVKTMHLKLPAFFATLCCLFFSFGSIAQPPVDCGEINCTANDVQIVKAYFADAEGKAISCPSDGSKVEGYLHVVLSTNTPRQGVSVSGDLIIDGNKIAIGACFGNELKGSSNDLRFPNAFQIECTSIAYLEKALVSWGVGNGQYCGGTAAQCPATKSKCRFTAGQIPIPIKLEVFFDWLAGDCSKSENGLAVQFNSQIALENVTVDSYSWTFGDGSTSDQPNPMHTYAMAGVYSVTLEVVGTDNEGNTVGPKSIILPVTVAACCNLSKPELGPFTFCELDGKTFGDLPQEGDGGFYNWFDAEDNGLVLTEAIPVGTHTYYVSLSKDNCESERTAVTVTVTEKLIPTFTQIDPVCSGNSIVLPTTSENGITGSWSPAVNNTSTTEYTFTPDEGQCATTTKMTVTVSPLPSCTITQTSPAAGNPKVGATAKFEAPIDYTYAWTLIGTNSANASVVNNTATSQSVDIVSTTTGSYTLQLVTTSTTAPYCTQTCTKTVTVDPVGPSVTYTKGYYGNSNGKTCDKKLVYSYQIMNAAVVAEGGSIRFGNPLDSRSFTLKLEDVNNSTKSNIFKMLPGGSTPAILKPAVIYLQGAISATYKEAKTWPAVPISSGSVVNNLLAQTMALKFNLYYSNYRQMPLGSIVLTGNIITFAKLATACGTTYATSGTTSTIPCNVFNELKNRGGTINELYKMANEVLGGTLILPASDMNNAVDIINRGFDAGGQIIGISNGCGSVQIVTQTAKPAIAEVVSEARKLTVSASPNPFTDRIRFTIQASKAGRATLEVYNMLGQKVGVPFEGQLNAGETRNVEYNAPVNHRSNLIYMLRMNGEQVSGKLMSTRQ